RRTAGRRRRRASRGPRRRPRGRPARVAGRRAGRARSLAGLLLRAFHDLLVDPGARRALVDERLRLGLLLLDQRLERVEGLGPGQKPAVDEERRRPAALELVGERLVVLEHLLDVGRG